MRVSQSDFDMQDMAVSFLNAVIVAVVTRERCVTENYHSKISVRGQS
jgi:hypothetical protein